MLCVVGDLVDDIVVRVAGDAHRGTDNEARIDRCRGGSGANVAAFAAVAGAGRSVRFIGRVGDDASGAALVEDLAAAGVDARVQRSGRTGVAVVFVDPDGERTMFPDRAAAVELADVDPSWLDGVTWLHLPGYSLLAEPIGATSIDLARSVRGAGGRLSVDVSSVGAVERFGPGRFAALLDVITPDVVFATAAEAVVIDTALSALLVVKDGPRPVVLTWPNGRSVSVEVDRVDDVVDTTGAGDAFAAGFLVALLRGLDAPAAARAGCKLASRTLRVAGAGL